MYQNLQYVPELEQNILQNVEFILKNRIEYSLDNFYAAGLTLQRKVGQISHLLGRSAPHSVDGTKDRTAHLFWPGMVAFPHHRVQLLVEHSLGMGTVEAQVDGIGKIEKSGVVALESHLVQGIIDVDNRNTHI